MSNIRIQIINIIFQRRWLGHVLFWFLLFLFYTNINTVYNDSIYKVLGHNLIVLVPQVLAAYTLAYFIIPKFLYKKKYFLFFLSLLISCYIFPALARILVVHIVEELYREPPFGQESILEILTDIKRLYKYYLYNVFLPVFLFISIKLLKERFEEKNKQELLEKEKVSAELNFFKAQIHPHFLFNTLNNLYTLTLQKSDKASDTVLKLSDILDYMLYQCNDKSVSIDKEIHLIQNYIELERLRYGKRLDLNFTQEIDDASTQIAPLLLISFVENAFKHGVSSAIKNPTIDIQIKVSNEQLFFSVFNTKTKLKQEDKTNFKEGIGLRNTKNQLQLLYPNKHHLEIVEKEQSFKIILNIDLRT